jgi:hypothetical protein
MIGQRGAQDFCSKHGVGGQVTWDGFVKKMSPLLTESFQEGLDEKELKLADMIQAEIEAGTILGMEVEQQRTKGKPLTKSQKEAVRKAQAASLQMFDGFAKEAEFVFKSLNTNSAGEVSAKLLLEGVNAKKEIVRMVSDGGRDIAYDSLNVNGNDLIDWMEFTEWAMARMNSVKATAIQSVYRGRAQRKEAAQQKAASTKIAAVQRGRMQRKEASDQKKAATKIQSVQRGKMSRRA